MFSFHAWPPNQFFPQSATLDQGFLRICAQRRFPKVGSPAVAHSCDVLQHGYVQLAVFQDLVSDLGKAAAPSWKCFEPQFAP